MSGIIGQDFRERCFTQVFVLAEDNHDRTYEVTITWPKGWETKGPVLNIIGTPGHWYMQTLTHDGVLGEGALNLVHPEMYVDYGQNWKIVNFQAVLNSALKALEKWDWKP